MYRQRRRLGWLITCIAASVDCIGVKRTLANEPARPQARAGVSLLYALAFICLVTSSVSAADESDVDVLLKRWEAACHKVWSYDIEVTTTHHSNTRLVTADSAEHVETFERELDEVCTIVTRQRYLNGKWRFDRLQEHWNPAAQNTNWVAGVDDLVFAISYNGNECRTFKSKMKFAEILPPSAIRKGSLLATHFQELYRATFSGEPYVSMVGKRDNLSIVARDSDGTTLEVPPDPRAVVSMPNSRFRFHFPAGAAALPDYFESYSPLNLDVAKGETRIVLEEVQPGIWFPIAATRFIFRTSKTGTERVLAAREDVRIDVAKSTFNQPIDGSVFELSFPSGTIVYSHNDSRNYVVSPQGEADYRGYATAVKKLIPNAAAAKLNVETRRTHETWMWLAFVLGLIVIVPLSMKWLKNRHLHGTRH